MRGDNMHSSENTNETSVEDGPAEPQRLASNTNEIAEGDEVEAHAEPQRLASNTNEDGIEDTDRS